MNVKVNLKRVLDGKPLNTCITRTKDNAPKPTPIEVWDRVKYTRSTGKRVIGLIAKTTRDCVYIFNTRTGLIVAASRSRVELRR